MFWNVAVGCEANGRAGELSFTLQAEPGGVSTVKNYSKQTKEFITFYFLSEAARSS